MEYFRVSPKNFKMHFYKLDHRRITVIKRFAILFTQIRMQIKSFYIYLFKHQKF